MTKRLSQILPLLLAIALQIMPLVRNLLLNPAATSNFACFLRLGLGTAATLGAVDAVSGASNPVVFSSGSFYSGTVGTYFTNNISITGNSYQTGDYFTLNNDTVFSAQLSNGISTTDCLPNGLTLTVHNPNNGSPPAQPIYCAMYGIPTTAVSGLNVNVNNGFQADTPVNEQIYFTIAAPAGQAPTITNQPVGTTNVAGGNATFTIKAGGVPTPAYQWRLTTTPLPGATNTSLTLTNIRASQAGNYVVVITNTSGSVTSSAAILGVTNPIPPGITSPANTAGQFHFTFIPVIGLTNTIQTNRVITGGTWGALTNIPPPATASPITITDLFNISNRFYRVQIVP